MEMNINKVLEAVNDKIKKLEDDLMFAKMYAERLEEENSKLQERIKELLDEENTND